MSCADVCEALSAYLDGELPRGEAAAVQAHLAVCPHCQRVLKEFELLSGMAKSFCARVAAPPGFEGRVLGRIASMEHSRQSVRLMWAAVLSSLWVILLAMGGAVTVVSPVGWAMVKTLARLAHTINLVLLRLWFGHAWVAAGTALVGMAIALACSRFMARLMSKWPDPKPSP